MKAFGIILASLMLITVIGSAQGPKNFIDQNYIEVTGKAEMEITPDEIYLNITIKEVDNKGKQSVELLENKMFEVLKKLKVADNLTMKDLASNFESYWLKKDDIFTSKQYELLVHDAQTAGATIRELEKIGISNIGIDRVDHSKIEDFRRQVKVNAVKAGKEKASDLAAAAGQSIGRALYIRENESFYGPVRNSNMMMMAKRSDALSEVVEVPDIQFEAIRLSYNVQLYFELK